MDLLNVHRSEALATALKSLIAALSGLQDWQPASIMASIKEVASAHQLKIPAIGQPMRLLLTGTLSSPSIDATTAILGRERVVQRLEQYFSVS